MYTSHTPLLAWAWGVVAPSEASMEAPQKVPKRHVADARCIQRGKICGLMGPLLPQGIIQHEYRSILWYIMWILAIERY